MLHLLQGNTTKPIMVIIITNYSPSPHPATLTPTVSTELVVKNIYLYFGRLSSNKFIVFNNNDNNNGICNSNYNNGRKNGESEIK